MKTTAAAFLLLFTCFTATAYEANLYDITAKLLGKPYQSNTITCDINSEKVDSKPESFDCVTFVEYSIAVYKNIDLAALRYHNKKQDCTHRNHFFIADWLKNNGIAEDITAKTAAILGVTLGQKTAAIDRQQWFAEHHGIKYPAQKETLTIAYIPVDSLLKTYKSGVFPEAALMMAVNKDTDIDISHVGFLFNTPNGLIFRHAGLRSGNVSDETMSGYVSQFKNSKSLLGFAFWEIK